MKGIGFTFDCVNLVHYKGHKINMYCVGSYVVSPDWIKKKKIAINCTNEDGNFFQHAVIVALNHEKLCNQYRKLIFS